MFICRVLLYIVNFFEDYSFCNNALTCVNCVMTNAVTSIYHFMCKWLPWFQRFPLMHGTFTLTEWTGWGSFLLPTHNLQFATLLSIELALDTCMV